ncbi:Type II secretion system protein E [Tepidimonas alkaliphilus]|uniref:Type II secretion system protein E n=1 Tax=Tepidimonas alkaliphilus TaxID=2588942 RepID=A0A554WAB7_9BURK|nr:GspE/PulE family protein [Tepidimonas alkaliphilus]TSE20519.1 Type II secretion system protein E [Tepidimonas alkaliphilus]
MSTGSHFTIPGLHHDETYPVGDRSQTVAVEGWNERVLQGYLVDFQPGQGIKVLPWGQSKALALRFVQVKRLRWLTAAWAPAATGDAALLTFVVHLRDGAIYSGRCYDCRSGADGLWIFPKVAAADDPPRVFIPHSAIAHHHVQRVDEALRADEEFSATVWQDDEGGSGEPQAGAASSASPAWITVETPEQLREALQRQATLRPVPIGEALLGLGKITPPQLEAALQRQKSTGAPLGQTLIEMGLIQPADLQVALARKMGYPFVDVRQYPVDPEALQRVPMALALRLRVLPLTLLDGALVVAMPDPLQFRAIDELEFAAQCKVIPVVSAATELQARIGELYHLHGLADAAAEALDVSARDSAALPPDASAQQLAQRLAGESAAELPDPEPGAADAAATTADNTLVRLINTMIVEAFHQGASDIHIEPYPGNEKIQIRFRVDGHLRPYLELPAAFRNALVARIKVMCDLDIAERRKPQDGKIDFKRFGGLPIELRVATIPTVNGMEDVVMRMLSAAEPMPLDKLQLSPDNLRRLVEILERPYGLFLCVGPTGSGKTTTLHAALRHINTPDRKIWTAEDPVEITQRGLRQIQVNPKIGWTFANALRAMLRADPDVIMVGEIRDAETAEMAIEASLTGHFVLSTLHTNSAAETVTRLHELGVDPFSFADSLQGVLAQRLVRKVCPACVRHEPLQGETLRELMLEYQTQLPADHPWRDAAQLHAVWLERFAREGQLWLPQPQGCAECGQTGYRGRLAIHELLFAHPDLHPLIVRREPPARLRDEAVRQGLRTLRQDGIEKALMGLTTLAEVRANSNL